MKKRRLKLILLFCNFAVLRSFCIKLALVWNNAMLHKVLARICFHYFWFCLRKFLKNWCRFTKLHLETNNFTNVSFKEFLWKTCNFVFSCKSKSKRDRRERFVRIVKTVANSIKVHGRRERFNIAIFSS